MKIFNFYFDKTSCIIHFECLTNTITKIKIVVCDMYIDCPLYSFNTVTGYNGWIAPIDSKLQSVVLSNSTYPGFIIKVYDENMKLIQFEKLQMNETFIDKFLEYYTDPYDITGPSYLDFFYGDLCKGIDTTKTVIDAGANVGFFTLYAIKNGADRVYSLEPDPSPYFYLNKNFTKYNNVVTINKALSHNKEDIQFVISKLASVANSEYLENRATEDQIYKTTIQSIDIETFLDIEGEINLVKLDIEGTEFRVIEHMTKKHFEKINQFFIEFHNSPKPIVDKLIENGYIVEYKHSNENDVVGFIYAYKNK